MNNARIVRVIGLEELEPFGKYKGIKIGPEEIKTAVVVSGGSDEVLESIDEKMDLFITGDSAHTYYHHSLEGRITVIFAGKSINWRMI